MIPGWLRPVFPDEGRSLVQWPVLRDLVSAHPLRGTVLNAGCGEGMYVPWILTFPDVITIENIDVAIPDWFHQRHPDPRVQSRVGSLTALPYPDAMFDAIVCTEVLEHIPDDRAAASELARVLKPGGQLIASVPHRPAPFDPQHVRPDYTIEEFRTLLAGAGFTIAAHRLCFHAPLRLVMHYWRRPWLRVGGNRTPYVPRVAMSAIALIDRVFRPGKPWDLVVRATKS